jgi:Outer membrane protein beta-barrel domain
MRSRLSLVAIAAAVLASRAEAGAGAGAYAAVRAGAYLPRGAAWKAYDPMLDLEIAAGVHLAPWLTVEGSVDRIAADSRVQQESLALVPIILSFRAELPVGVIRPYAVIGGGLELARFERDGSARDSATVVVGEVGLGASGNIGEQVFAAVEARYLAARARVFGVERQMDAVRVLGGLGYRF